MSRLLDCLRAENNRTLHLERAGSTEPNLNLSDNSVKLFLREPLIIRINMAFSYRIPRDLRGEMPDRTGLNILNVKSSNCLDI